MNNPAKFVDELKRFSNRIGNVTEKTIGRIRNLSNKEAEGLGRIRDVSSACEQIYNWLQSTLKLYDINKKVEPMKRRVTEMTKKLNQLSLDLQATETLLERLTSELKELNDNKKIK